MFAGRVTQTFVFSQQTLGNLQTPPRVSWDPRVNVAGTHLSVLAAVIRTDRLTCAVKKAGVREPEGSVGLLRAMEPMSLPASSTDGDEISRALGFLPLGGSPSP